MYADDINKTISARDTEELVQKTQVGVENISEWMRINKMRANPEKTEYLIIGHPCGTNTITDIAKFNMNGVEIKKEFKVKSLWLFIDEKLNWSNHFKLLKGKVAAGSSSLKQLKDNLSQFQLYSVCRA